MDLDDSVEEGGEVALILELDEKIEKINLQGYAVPRKQVFSRKEKHIFERSLELCSRA